MILSSLAAYYDRLSREPEPVVPLSGFSRQKIHFALHIDADGRLAEPPVFDLRQTDGKKATPQELVVPEAVKRSVGVAANFLWDNTGYVLGADDKGKPERTAKTFAAFKARCHAIGDGLDDAGMAAVLAFLDAWDPADAPDLPRWEEMVKGCNLVFRLAGGGLGYVHERPAVRQAWLDHLAGASKERRGMCLVTGQDAPIAKLHPKIQGVRDAQSVGALLVSYNQHSFESYGKEQSYNGPVGEPAAFAYTTALNHLLRKGSRQRVQIGDATTVFWTERTSEVEGLLGFLFDPTADDGSQAEVRLFLEAVRDGKHPAFDAEILQSGFFILGLAPNAARLSVRFWHQDTVDGVCQTVGRHFAALNLERTWDTEPEFPGLWQLLRETAPQNDLKNVNPALAGALMRSILTDAPYPASLPAAVIARIRADQTVNYLRAAMLKAYLVRNTPKEVSVSLDQTSADIGYRLGRLFAVLEKAQQEAIPGANTTIRDRYYGSASATPAAVFPQLMRLAQHHIEKAEYGGVSDRRIEEILGAVQTFPKHLSLDEQGMFAIGYYHQRRENYKKTAKTKGED
ncbi:CRISPR-associated protein, Csd1 family [Solidesulfovibrio carbinoliphilus subsp. oakridgensis]|uniref:CRISPR-associated protein, Csd1 family n=1 Tax=Solidesulfovibrio carbinoliphilus subsp. oakridgensis TaxID=694327 RepID=G7Q7M0_9BACT|nr:type I-C CRISPR-associated protein Cas8c/Csd1 [Solidesulfovibrio carbinoliphilus]EHJ47329.1 CRISPR-associated protein, Csd1 family [Solidesulfovibrio carbinoliphilus subsp. oakridgensis]